MIEYVCLYAFIGNPDFIGRKEIEFQRDTGFRRLELADHASQFLINGRKAFQIISQVSAKNAQICLTTPVYEYSGDVGEVSKDTVVERLRRPDGESSGRI